MLEKFQETFGYANVLIIAILLIGLMGSCAQSAFAENALMEEFNGNTYSPEPPQKISYVDTSWTPWNIGMFSFCIMGHSLDVMSTQHALDNGAEEMNPIYGSDPSMGRMIITKVIYMGLVYYITEYYLVPAYGTNARNWSYGASGVLSAGISVWNYNQVN